MPILTSVLVVSPCRFASANNSRVEKRNNFILLFFAENRASRTFVVFGDKYVPITAGIAPEHRRYVKQDALLLGFPDRWHEEKTPTKG
jgi:hypothetical protein